MILEFPMERNSAAQELYKAKTGRTMRRSSCKLQHCGIHPLQSYRKQGNDAVTEHHDQNRNTDGNAYGGHDQLFCGFAGVLFFPAPRNWEVTTAPPVANAANTLMIRLLNISIRDTPETAASPAEDIMTVSAMPTVIASACSNNKGMISFSDHLLKIVDLLYLFP